MSMNYAVYDAYFAIKIQYILLNQTDFIWKKDDFQFSTYSEYSLDELDDRERLIFDGVYLCNWNENIYSANKID